MEFAGKPVWKFGVLRSVTSSGIFFFTIFPEWVGAPLPSLFAITSTTDIFEAMKINTNIQDRLPY